MKHSKREKAMAKNIIAYIVAESARTGGFDPHDILSAAGYTDDEINAAMTAAELNGR